MELVLESLGAAAHGAGNAVVLHGAAPQEPSLRRVVVLGLRDLLALLAAPLRLRPPVVARRERRDAPRDRRVVPHPVRVLLDAAGLAGELLLQEPHLVGEGARGGR